MNDEQMQPILDTFYRDREIARPKVQTGVASVMTQVPRTRQRSRRWPFPVFSRRTETPTATDTADYQPSPIPATNGHSPTVLVRTQSMFSPVKAITAGALVFALGGVLLIAQPFDQQGRSVPGAATDGVGQGAAAVSGQIDSMVRGDEPDFIYGGDPNDGGFEYYRNEEYLGRAEMSDERLSGEVHLTLNDDRWGEYEEPETVAVHWGTVSIENDAGTWLGTHTFVEGHAEGLVAHHMELVGSGAYEGLSAILYASEDGEHVPGREVASLVYGAVFPGNLPPDRESYLPE
jgi:hypothetical protein